MSHETVCITNNMRDVRSCTIKREHQTGCDGWEYTWGEDVEQYVATGRECVGCLPRVATNGQLCTVCWNAAESAENAYPSLANLLATHDKLVSPMLEGGGGSSAPAIPIPATRIALDEIESYRRSHPGNLDAWVKTAQGAADAVRFSRAVRRALAAFPSVEDAHRIQRARCPHCELLSLMWTPPVFESDPVRIVCLNPACGLKVEQATLEPATPVVWWTGTESSTQRVVDHARQEDNSYVRAYVERNGNDIFDSSLTLRTFGASVTIRRGDGIRKSEGIWERVPAPISQEAS